MGGHDVCRGRPPTCQTREVIAHALVTVLGEAAADNLSAACSCGWRSPSSRSMAHAASRWSFHVVEQAAASRCEVAIEVRRVANARRVELVAERERVRERRQQILVQRRRLEIRRMPAWLALAGAARASQLQRAQRFLDVSMADLWLDYVSMGGNADVDLLQEMMDGAVEMSRIDHDRVGVVLNERFANEGLGQPVSYWGDVR
jgi:hypothetical protein